MHVAFVSKDRGNAEAGLVVAREFVKRGCGVNYFLDSRGAAWAAFQSDWAFRGTFSGVSVIETSNAEVLSGYPEDVVLVTLSASGVPNLELEVCGASCVWHSPLYGLEETIGGRGNPGWSDSKPPLLQRLKRLFSVMPTNDLCGCPVTVIGSPQLERYRGVGFKILGAAAYEKLQLSLSAPLVYYIGQPDEANPHVLSRLGEALHRLRPVLPECALVVSRHDRDKGIPDNGAAHRHALRYIQQMCGMRVIENSLDHRHLPSENADAIPPEFRPSEFASYQELVCACDRRGVIVTGFATDGVLIAPHLGIPSILYLDEGEFLFGGLLRREKQMSRLPLRVVPQVGSVDELHHQLLYLLDFRKDGRRQHYCEDLQEVYPFPKKNPAAAIAEHVLRDLSAVSTT